MLLCARTSGFIHARFSVFLRRLAQVWLIIPTLLPTPGNIELYGKAPILRRAPARDTSLVRRRF